ncbi:hypothetical protein IJH01_00855 [Candidatus Saccharibacteria bacterium]|nr:hypothetical protein [Candidatus Saccharibacteria bacterium]
MATQKKDVFETSYKNRQEMQRDVLRLAADKGWRTIQAKGEQMIIRR